MDQQAAASAEEAGREFGISLKELENLMQTRGHDGIRELNETYGGLSGMGQKLKTNLITGKKKRSISPYLLWFFFSFSFSKVYQVMRAISLRVSQPLVAMKSHRNHRKPSFV